MDEQLPDSLRGFTLDAVEGTPHSLQTYRPIAVDAEGGRDSMVLDATLRWAEGDIQCWHAGQGTWVSVADIPVLQAEMKGALELCGPILHHLLDATEPGAADLVLQTWMETAPPTWPNQETLERLASAPWTWRRLLLGEPCPRDGAD